MVSKPYYIVICVLVCVFKLPLAKACYLKKKKVKYIEKKKKERKEEKLTCISSLPTKIPLFKECYLWLKHLKMWIFLLQFG